MSVDDIKAKIEALWLELDEDTEAVILADTLDQALLTAVEALGVELESPGSQNSHDHISHALATIRKILGIGDDT